MIYSLVQPDHPVDQGDIIEGCPFISIRQVDWNNPQSPNVVCELVRAYVLTQTCDLAQGKTRLVIVAAVVDAATLVAEGRLKTADIRGPIRAGRVHGWYYLPKSASLRLSESIVDLRNLQKLPLEVIEELCRFGRRIGHLESPYREHLAKHFADTYSRIGLPMPYETD